MRHVQRDWDLAPAYLTDPATTQAVADLGEFLDSGGVSAKQSYLELDETQILAQGADEIGAALWDQFESKCAFTEMPLNSLFDPTHMHLLRPGQGARDDRGGVPSDRHYWWLVNDWSNIYLADPEIGSLQGQVFPVRGERQSKPGAQLDQGVLLDPCQDLPEWYLRFDESGTVSSAWASAVFDPGPVSFSPEFAELIEANRLRGSTSIRLFGLDRDAVQQSRARAFEQAGISRPLASTDQAVAVLSRLDEDTAHLGAIRQVLARQVLSLDELHVELVEALRPELAAVTWTEPRAGDRLVELLGRGASEIFALGGEVFDLLVDHPGPVSHTGLMETRPADQVDARPLPSGPTTAPRTLAPTITRITIRDFKAVELVDVEIDTTTQSLSEPNRFQRLYEELAAKGGDASGFVTDAAKRVVQSRVFIGENGSGKSSILQAIALALASDVERSQLGVDVQDFIRWDITPDGPKPNPTRQAVIVVEMLSATFTLRIKPDGQVIHEAHDRAGEPIDTTGNSPWFLMRAYSATRTLKGEDSSREPLSIRNLFDPRVPLVKPEDWLLSLDDVQFGTVAATLHQLFNESNADGSSPVASSLMARVPEGNPTKVVVGNVELRHLSDGYRAVITLFCDIMAAAQQLNPTDMRSAEGIVLIDEIGAHLHPRWRTRISSLIRREFASMQIIVSTHEPLCMRGFLGGEVVLVERDDDVGVRLTQIERNPTGLRVDQLLTSEFFGMYTTLDPDENDRLNLYYQLRAKQAEIGELAVWENALLERVKPDETEQVFGFSYREQLTYEAIDGYLTDRRSRITPEEQRARRDAAFKEVSEIWRAFERRLDPDDPA